MPGAHAWGLLMGSFSGGALLGGFVVTARRDVRRPLLWATSASCGVKWDVTMQRQIPEHLLSRVAAYDMLGSIVCMPLGQVAVEPLQSAIGRSSAIWVCATVAAVATMAVFAVRDVRTMTNDAPSVGGRRLEAAHYSSLALNTGERFIEPNSHDRRVSTDADG
jgi:hypothetical protein